MPSLPESAMSPLASEWLAQQGFEVYAEVPHYSTSVDLVGVRWEDEAIITIELKTNLSHKVICQAAINQIITEQSYAAVPTRPARRSIQQARKVGIGIIRLNNVAAVIVQPNKVKSLINPYCRTNILNYCQRSEPGGIGGLPVLAGRGPAQRCHAEVLKYIADNPAASWQAIFAAVPNHYCNITSLRGCMRKLELWGKAKHHIGKRSLREQEHAYAHPH